MSKISFVSAYIDCAFWSSVDGEGNSFDNYKPAANTLYNLTVDAEKFYDEHHELWDDDTQAGHDFWLIRGYGCWDSGLKHADELTTLSIACGKCDLYIGNDNLVYIL